MAFYETRLPDTISYHPVGGPDWGGGTKVVQVESGQEYRNQAWTQPLRRYEISYDARLPADASQILGAFMVNQGRTHGFRLKDYVDFSAVAAEGVFVLLTPTTFQLYKRYMFGGVGFDRKIVKLATTPVVTGGVVSSWNLNTGVVTMTSGTPTAASFEFDVPVRFDLDALQGEVLESILHPVGYKSIPIVEIRL